MEGQRCALWLWYRGDRFRGYQAQPQGPTVQRAVEAALQTLDIRSFFAPSGRTDKGVHARKQVLSGRIRSGVSAADLAEPLSRRLAPDAGVCAGAPASRAFHAQWSCVGKEYRYRVALGPVPAAWQPFVWSPANHPRLAGRPLAPERIAEQLRQCLGTHDFIAFHEKSSARKPRTLGRAEFAELAPGLFEARLSGDGFGRYQVRYLVGSAVASAAGAVSPSTFADAVSQGLPLEGLRAPAQGLILWDVFYPTSVDPFADPPQPCEGHALPDEPPFSYGPTRSFAS
jgi:tRNA pseudouridine38-40 synthase